MENNTKKEPTISITGSGTNTTSDSSGNYYYHVEGDINALPDMSTTTTTFTFSEQKTLISSKFVEDNELNYIEMIYEVTTFPFISNTGAFYNTTTEKSMLKEIYSVKDGKLQLIRSIKGVEKPGYYVPPTTDWEE